MNAFLELSTRSPRRTRALPAAAVAVALGLAACSHDAGPKQTGGTIIGAIAGGLAGSTIGGGSGRHIAIGVGTLLGAVVGSEVGRSLDRADRLYAERTAQRTLEHGATGEAGAWVNPDTGHSGTVTPRRDYYDPGGRVCRDYETTVTIDGRTESAYGTACRQADGSWRIMNG
ncbi:MAG TPA: RT0821/Lpp0805 family surface protein [Alphaproteobacteria bacterium]|nr:RT0821/Lpp0805 family surface protein [Alphaproteobacteria bacterium]